MSFHINLHHPTAKWLNHINQELSRSKLPPYNYDKNLVPLDIELPYLSWTHADRYYYKNLKIIAAKLWQDPNWVTDRDFVSPEYQKDSEIEFTKYLLEETRDQDKSHLICLNYSGSYIPVDFGSIDLPLWSIRCCGSSFNLCRELEVIAKSLKFALARHYPYFAGLREIDEEYRREIEIMDKEDILIGEKVTLMEIYNMASFSIKYNVIIDVN